MNISTSKLPPLPKVPNNGKGRLEAAIDYTGPQMVETRLGSIPADYESWTGWERTERIYFRGEHKEAENPYGRSVPVWRPQPTYNQDGSPRMIDKTEQIVAEPKSTVTNPLIWGAGGAAAGGLVGLVAGAVGGFDIGLSAGLGAGAGALAGALLGFRDAETDRVRLEWQETNVTEKDLVGYIHDVDEDQGYVCDGFGDDRRCRWETDDYEHEFRPIIEETTVGTYWRPVVVHYKES